MGDAMIVWYCRTCGERTVYNDGDQCALCSVNTTSTAAAERMQHTIDNVEGSGPWVNVVVGLNDLRAVLRRLAQLENATRRAYDEAVSWDRDNIAGSYGYGRTMRELLAREAGRAEEAPDA